MTLVVVQSDATVVDRHETPTTKSKLLPVQGWDQLKEATFVRLPALIVVLSIAIAAQEGALAVANSSAENATMYRTRARDKKSEGRKEKGERR